MILGLAALGHRAYTGVAMMPLEPPAKITWILSFDFDGTLHNPEAHPPVEPEFFAWIRRLREEPGAIWGINTGRSMNHVLEGLVESRFPFAPDWVVARERELWFPNPYGRWVADEVWNKRCEKAHRKFFKRVKKLLRDVRHEVQTHTGATWVEQDGDPAGLVAQSEEEMAWIMTHLPGWVANEPELGWQRNSIYLRFGHKDYQKGSSLTEILRRYGLASEHCFAMGDSHNDFDMLSPQVAARIACPANAAPDICEHVNQRGGYLARNSHSAGCIEALRHFFGPVSP